MTSSSPDNQVHGSTSDEEQPVSGGEGSASKEGGGAPLRNTFEEQGSGMSGQSTPSLYVCACVCVCVVCVCVVCIYMYVSLCVCVCVFTCVVVCVCSGKSIYDHIAL